MGANKVRRPTVAWVLVAIGVVLLILAGLFGIIAATQANWSVRPWRHYNDFETIGLFKACSTKYKYPERICREHGDERPGIGPVFPPHVLNDGGFVKSAQGCFIAAIVFVILAGLLGLASLCISQRRHILGGLAIFLGFLAGILFAVTAGLWYGNIEDYYKGAWKGGMYAVVICCVVFTFIGTLLLLATYCIVKNSVERVGRGKVYVEGTERGDVRA